MFLREGEFLSQAGIRGEPAITKEVGHADLRYQAG